MNHYKMIREEEDSFYDEEDPNSDDGGAARTRGQARSVPANNSLAVTKQKWVKEHELYHNGDVGNGVQQDWVGKKTGIGLFEGTVICFSCTQNNNGTLVYVPQDRHDHLSQHFGFGNSTLAKKHGEGLPAFWKQPRLEFNAPKSSGVVDKSVELMKDLAMAAALGGASVPQMGQFVQLIKKWVDPSVSTLLPKDPYAIMAKGLPLAACKVELAAEEERKGFQQHLAGDAASDNRGRSVYITTTEFGDGKSQIVDIAFPDQSLDSKSLGEINSRVIASIGGTEKVDTYAHDSAAYMVLWGKTLDTTYTLDMGDVIHRLDGAMDRMFESCPELLQIVSCLNNLMCKTHRGFVQGFSTFVQKEYEFRMYPSPGETRAWTGTYRVLEWCYLYLDLLVTYVTTTFPRTADPSEKLVAFYDFACDAQRVAEFRVILVWYLQYCADFVLWIMQLQSRTVPSAHLIFDTLLTMIEFTVHSREKIKTRDFFDSKVLLGNDQLQRAYRALAGKKRVKDIMVAAVEAAGKQLSKNFGVFARNIGEASWNLTFTREGDVIRPPQVNFYAISSALNISKRNIQLPPAREMFDLIPWKYDNATLDKIHQQLTVLLKDGTVALPPDGNLKAFYQSLELSQKIKYGAVARFALRCLSVPGGSAEVERAVSVYNRIVTTDRTALSDARIQDYVKIFANGNSERKSQNEKRSLTSLAAQKKKKEEREFEIEGVYQPPKKARAAAAADNDD